MSNLKFNKISIIESLRDCDRKTGEELSFDLDYLDEFKKKDILIEYVQVSNKDELISHINYLEKDAQENGIFPILQIEAHGVDDKENLQLKSGTISWLELEPVFRNLNIASKCNLLVVMATCYGSYVNCQISMLDRAPFWGLIGTPDTIMPEQILNSMTRFYSSLNNGEDIKALLASLEDKTKMENLVLTTSEWAFVKSYQLVLRKSSSEQSLCHWAEEMRNRKKIQGGTPPKLSDIINWALKFKDEKVFYKLLHHFFMVDIYPDNMDKISVKFDHLCP